MPEIIHEGDTFNVRVEGPTDAPVLFLSNSLSSDLLMWEDQIPGGRIGFVSFVTINAVTAIALSQPPHTRSRNLGVTRSAS